MTGDGDGPLPLPALEQAALLAHQFRGPLAGIRTTAETLASGHYGSLTPAQQAAVEGIGRRCRQLGDVVEAMATLHELEANPHAAGRHAVEVVSEVVAPIVDDPGRRDNGRRMRLAVAADGRVVVQADARLLAIVVGNLVDNAIRYGREGSEIRIAAGSDGEAVVLAVRNEGDVIPDAELGRLFRPFVRLRRPGTEGVAGSGLGLYLCRRIVEAMGGTIGARCDERGTIEFRIELPAGTP